MKILFLARYLPQEGSTTHMYSLARGLMNKGHEVHLMSAGPKKEVGAIEIFESIINDGLNHHLIKFPLSPKFNTWGKVKQLMCYLSIIPLGIYTIYRLKPDVIHAHYPVTTYLAKIYCKLTKKKFITTHHISGIPKHPLHKKADAVIAISSELKIELTTVFGYKESEVSLIYNGIYQEKFDFSRNIDEALNFKKILDIPKDKVIIGYVGSIIYRKGIDILIDSLLKIDATKYHLVIVGDGDLKWLNKMIRESKLNHNCSVFDFQDPVEFYKVFDFLVLPSRQEGFGLVTVEAMMTGIPIIRSNVEGAYDQINQGINGYIFESENSNDLKVYIEKLIDSKEKREELGINAKYKALQSFTQSQMVESTLALYKEMI